MTAVQLEIPLPKTGQGSGQTATVELPPGADRLATQVRLAGMLSVRRAAGQKEWEHVVG